MYLRNIAEGPRGVNTRDGVVYLAPGEGRDVEVTEGEAASIRASGWFALTPERASRDRRSRKAKTNS